MRLEGKSIVITGGSKGMGKSMVKLFANEGANVVTVARHEEDLKALEEDVAGAPGKVVTYTGDISDKAVAEAVVALAVETFGKLDVLVNNAGEMDDISPVGELSDEILHEIINVDLIAPIYTMRKAVKIFQEQGEGGKIINISSLGAKHSTAGISYATAKAGLLAATQNTAYMYYPEKIYCNAILPGRIETGIMPISGMPNLKGYRRALPLFKNGPEGGDPECIAKAALFLASDDAEYISGAELVVDGGWGTI